MQLVIVESPAKAKTIEKYLGRDFKVLASYGHVRDLPSKDGSVLPDDDFAMSWEIDPKASKRMSEIAEAAKRADRVILATDPDREGEAISWHLLEALTKRKAASTSLTDACFRGNTPTDMPLSKSTSKVLTNSIQPSACVRVPIMTKRLRTVSTRTRASAGTIGRRMVAISPAPMYCKGIMTAP